MRCCRPGCPHVTRHGQDRDPTVRSRVGRHQRPGAGASLDHDNDVSQSGNQTIASTDPMGLRASHRQELRQQPTPAADHPAEQSPGRRMRARIADRVSATEHDGGPPGELRGRTVRCRVDAHRAAGHHVNTGIRCCLGQPCRHASAVRRGGSCPDDGHDRSPRAGHGAPNGQQGRRIGNRRQPVRPCRIAQQDHPDPVPTPLVPHLTRTHVHQRRRAHRPAQRGARIRALVQEVGHAPPGTGLVRDQRPHNVGQQVGVGPSRCEVIPGRHAAAPMSCTKR